MPEAWYDRGSFTNTGTINLSSSSFENGSGPFNHNAGSMILGTGSFSNSGILELNVDLIFPAAIPFNTSGTVRGNGNLTVNNTFEFSGIIEGNGSLTVNGNTTWNSGTLDRPFTNQAGRTLTMGTANSKTLLAPLCERRDNELDRWVVVLNAAVDHRLRTMESIINGQYQDNGGMEMSSKTVRGQVIAGHCAINNLTYEYSPGHIKGLVVPFFGGGTL